MASKPLMGWLIYTKSDFARNEVFARRFLGHPSFPDVAVRLVFREDLFLGIYNGGPYINGTDWEGIALKGPDFVINRTMDNFLSEHLEKMGISVFNPSKISRICNDKARTYQEASALGLPVMDTLFTDKEALRTPDFFKSPQLKELGFPLVVKSVDGRGGKEVMLAREPGEIIGIAEGFKSERLLLQKLCGMPGRDVRVFVVGKTIAGAIERRSDVSFKANYTLGGTAAPYSLSAEETAMVMKVVKHFDFGLVGIDFIFDAQGRFVFNEIEDVVGTRTLSIYTDTDIVALYLGYIRGCFNN